ncbi:MAG: hypothetical protein EAZ95_09015 [Bacteroidetes bacterium]|nr:MAG: hypothetical protein EAZ95_09015 [Bacteroidota bacterium]
MLFTFLGELYINSLIPLPKGGFQIIALETSPNGEGGEKSNNLKGTQFYYHKPIEENAKSLTLHRTILIAFFI